MTSESVDFYFIFFFLGDDDDGLASDVFEKLNGLKYHSNYVHFCALIFLSYS